MEMNLIYFIIIICNIRYIRRKLPKRETCFSSMCLSLLWNVDGGIGEALNCFLHSASSTSSFCIRMSSASSCAVEYNNLKKNDLKRVHRPGLMIKWHISSGHYGSKLYWIARLCPSAICNLNNFAWSISQLHDSTKYQQYLSDISQHEATLICI